MSESLGLSIGVANLVAARSLPFPLVLWSVQNRCYEVLQKIFPQVQEKAARDKTDARWVAQFQELAALLSLRVGEPEA